MKKMTLSIYLLITSILFTSCSSIESRNHFDDTFPGTYPGIQYINNEWQYLEHQREKKYISRSKRDFKRLGLVIDYPFSAILDTLAYPFDMGDK